MRHLISAVCVGLVLVAWGCKKNGDGEVEKASDANFSFEVLRDTYLKSDAETQAADLGWTHKCSLKKGTKLILKEKVKQSENSHYFVKLKSNTVAGLAGKNGGNCVLLEGFVYQDHVKLSSHALNATLSTGKTLGSPGDASDHGGGTADGKYCVYSWDQKPGTTDYTTYDTYTGTYASNADRKESQTLLGDKVHQGRSLCEKARYLKPCFDKVITNATSAEAKAFKQWGKAHGVDPVLALMAKTQQETKMGILPDSCSGSGCNGIGIGQIITAIDTGGQNLSSSDSRWKGITFNILTNLEYSVRVVEQKIDYSPDLWSLAYNYNGSEYASSYASAVVGYYENLSRCGL